MEVVGFEMGCFRIWQKDVEMIGGHWEFLSSRSGLNIFEDKDGPTLKSCGGLQKSPVWAVCVSKDIGRSSNLSRQHSGTIINLHDRVVLCANVSPVQKSDSSVACYCLCMACGHPCCSHLWGLDWFLPLGTILATLRWVLYLPESHLYAATASWEW